MFSSLYSALESQFGALTNAMLLGFFGLLIIMGVLPILLIRPKEPFDKVKQQRIKRAEVEQELKPKKENQLKARIVTKIESIQHWASFLEPRSTDELNETRIKMVRGGYRNKSDLRMFYFLQLVLGVAGLVLATVFIVYLSFTGGLRLERIPLYIVLGSVTGFFLPRLILSRRISARKAEIVSGFPDALDLMMVSVEAGQSMDQSMFRIAKETRQSHPALADELDIVNQEIKAGKDRVTVLKEFAYRVDDQDISSFVGTLVQSIVFGTPMSEALKMYSFEMRDKRAMRAEEAANKIPTKLTLITMVFTMPPIMLIMMGPMLYNFSQ